MRDKPEGRKPRPTMKPMTAATKKAVAAQKSYSKPSSVSEAGVGWYTAVKAGKAAVEALAKRAPAQAARGAGKNAARKAAAPVVKKGASQKKPPNDPWTGKGRTVDGGRDARNRADWRQSRDWRGDFPVTLSGKGPARGVTRPKGKVKNADGTVSKPRSSTAASASRAQRAAAARLTAQAKKAALPKRKAK